MGTLGGRKKIYELYGGTEAQALSWITGEEWMCHRDSVGRPIIGEMMVVGENSQEVPCGTVGEICNLPNKGRDSTYIYLGGEAQRLPNTDCETLGDMGWMINEDFVYLAHRRKDLIIRGGENIYPAEVEAALVEQHPAVRSCAVVGLPDVDLGQRIHAIVDVPDASSDEA
uniref:AMP-binding enzyme C-terminal domain-containing protein n=1 Tax=Odontella aurita TaxID=265563 RepID=A0A6U6DW53_9STRA|mmetsp:Transcript_22136/g.65654  ORF Transcript_22136/g.65654 Transcript_22136/m.65654 type:complete len:170 (+) Transcript_22136:626-1135(+)